MIPSSGKLSWRWEEHKTWGTLVYTIFPLPSLGGTCSLTSIGSEVEIWAPPLGQESSACSSPKEKITISWTPILKPTYPSSGPICCGQRPPHSTKWTEPLTPWGPSSRSTRYHSSPPEATDTARQSDCLSWGCVHMARSPGGSHRAEGSEPPKHKDHPVGFKHTKSEVGHQSMQILFCCHTNAKDLDKGPGDPDIWGGQALPVCQPGRTSLAEDLGLGPLNLRYVHPPEVPQLRMLILLLVGLPASGDFMIAIPMCHLLLEVS